ncbi:hypothetical protein J7L48_05610 [bacterium]|nr:hypothetical protein [bacterium]
MEWSYIVFKCRKCNYNIKIDSASFILPSKGSKRNFVTQLDEYYLCPKCKKSFITDDLRKSMNYNDQKTSEGYKKIIDEHPDRVIQGGGLVIIPDELAKDVPEPKFFCAFCNTALIKIDIEMPENEEDEDFDVTCPICGEPMFPAEIYG